MIMSIRLGLYWQNIVMKHCSTQGPSHDSLIDYPFEIVLNIHTRNESIMLPVELGRTIFTCLEELPVRKTNKYHIS